MTSHGSSSCEIDHLLSVVPFSSKMVWLDKRSSMNKTKGQVEAEISNALIQFEKDYKGRGPEETKTIIVEDMVLVRLKGVLTPAERQLAKNPEGMNLIKKVRSNLIECNVPNCNIEPIIGSDLRQTQTSRCPFWFPC